MARSRSKHQRMKTRRRQQWKAQAKRQKAAAKVKPAATRKSSDRTGAHA